MNITPDAWQADTEHLRARITRLEAQSEARRLQVAYWKCRAETFQQEATDERGAALDQIEQVKIRDARIKAVRDVLELHGPAHDEPDQDPADCGPQIIADIRRALDVSPD